MPRQPAICLLYPACYTPGAMVTLKNYMTAKSDEVSDEAPPTRSVSSGEVLLLAAVLGVALLGWSGLALADVGRYSLRLALGLALLGWLAVVAVAWRVTRPAIVLDRTGLLVLAGLALVAVVLFFPGFPYGVGDKDPGVYVIHAIEIARNGSISWTDPALQRVQGVTLTSPGALWPALWIQSPGSAVISPQFYHLWPALLASAFTAGGYTGLVNLNPLLGVLAVLVLALAVRRVFGLLAGSLAGLLLAASMLQVWQSKYPTTEVLTELLVAGALLAVVIALQTGWRPAAGAGGLLLGIAFLARPDGLLEVLLAFAALLTLLVLRRFDARAGWFAAGLAVTLPHGLVQAYGIAGRYTLSNDVPGLRSLAVLAVAGVVVAVLARRLLAGLAPRVVALAQDRRVQFRLGMAILVAATGLMALGFLRPKLFGAAYYLPDNGGAVLRSFDEQSLQRLSWFFTLPGMAVMLLGLAVVALRRWRAVAWTLVLPVLLMTPLYAWHGRVASRLMWWTRRFIPVVVPGMTILIAVALAAGLTWAIVAGRWRWAQWPVRVASAVVAGFLLVVFLSQSLPLRHHAEFAGSFELTQRVAHAAGGRQGVFLWQQQRDNRIFSPGGLLGGPMAAQEGQVSVFLPYRPDLAYVHKFTNAFPGQPVFVLWAGDQPPPVYASLGLEQVDRIAMAMPMWQESDTQRPSQSRDVVVDFSIWHIHGT
jgi:hypothetical protein